MASHKDTKIADVCPAKLAVPDNEAESVMSDLQSLKTPTAFLEFALETLVGVGRSLCGRLYQRDSTVEKLQGDMLRLLNQK